MRIWSLHPSRLDPQGLVALWRETLLAQKVLCGKTRGYKNHPQLDRFKAQADPLAAVGRYLQAVCDEAEARGYNFDRSKVHRKNSSARKVKVSRGQMRYEWKHLKAKLEKRNPDYLKALGRRSLEPHPLFRVVDGGIEDWERP